jgi:carotenoid cleavage dioxygenase
MRCHCDAPVVAEWPFVPRSEAIDEDDRYVIDAKRNASDVVVLSARDFSGPPLAVVELPVRVPFGFHGDWIPDRR